MTSDAWLLAYRDLDDALGLFDSSSALLFELRTSKNVQHDFRSLLRQSVYSRLTCYDDVNDVQRLSDVEADQDQRKGRNAQPLHGLPDGGGGRLQGCLCGNTRTNQPIAMLYCVIITKSYRSGGSVRLNGGCYIEDD